MTGRNTELRRRASLDGAEESLVDLRHLRYFAAAAEAESFSRAADALYVTQPALTRQVRQLEERLGAPLFVRAPRGIGLTPTGARLLPAVQHLLERLEAGIDHARRVARGDVGTLRLGFHVGAALELTGPILDEFRRRHPHLEISLAEIGVPDMSAGTRDGTSDVAIVRLPIEMRDLDHEVLFREPLSVMLNVEHPLADRDDLSFDEIADEPVVMWAADDRPFVEYWVMMARRREPPRVRARITTYNEALELIVRGAVVALTPAATARYFPRPEISFVPVIDAPPSEVAVVWRGDSDEPAVSAFVDAARTVRDRRRELIRAIEAGRDPTAQPSS